MKRFLSFSCMPMLMAFSAAGEGAPAVAAAPVAVERLKQNGFTRPLAGTKTGLVWDIADAISAKLGRPAMRDEVIKAYKEQVADASNGTISTQYSRWCGFHGVSDVLRKMRADQKAAENSEAEKAKADAAEKKAAEKEAKEKAKAEKAAAAAAKKAEREAAAKAKAEAAAAATAAAANTPGENQSTE